MQNCYECLSSELHGSGQDLEYLLVTGLDGIIVGLLLKTVTQWVRSFLANRTAHIRLDKVKSKAFSILCGLPQGSPISPILFLLYVEPFLRLTKERFGYADDGAMLAIGATTQVVYNKLQEHLDITLA
jgi:hypothetical protein